MNNAFLAEELGLKAGGEPYDLNTVTAQARISLAKGERLAVIVNLGTSAIASTVTFNLNQHNAASAGTTKDLAVANPYYKKVAAATKFTQVVPTVAAASIDLSTDFSLNPGEVVFEILGDDLDNELGFNWFSISIADSTQAKLASVQYLLNGMKFKPAYSEDL